METNNNYCDALDQTNDKLVAQIADVSDRSYDRCVR